MINYKRITLAMLLLAMFVGIMSSCGADYTLLLLCKQEKCFPSQMQTNEEKPY